MSVLTQLMTSAAKIPSVHCGVPSGTVPARSSGPPLSCQILAAGCTSSGRPIRYCNIVTLGHRERLDQVGHLPALSVNSSEQRSCSVARSDAQYARGAGVSERMNRSGRNMHEPARLNSLCHIAANKIHLAFNDVEGFIPWVRVRRWANSFRGIMYVDFVASSLSMVRQDCDFLAKHFAWRDPCTISNYWVPSHWLLLY